MKKIITIIVILFMIIPLVEARDAISLYREAKSYLEEGSDDMAFMFFRQILHDYPKSKYADEALFRISKYYLDSKSFRSAEDRLAKYIKEYPKGQFIEKAKYHLNKIRLAKAVTEADNLCQKGNYEKAIKIYNQAMELTSEKKAIKDKINQCRQKSIKEKVDKADKLYGDQNWNKALTLYNKIIKNNPNLVDIKEKIKKCKENIEFEKKQIEKGLVKYKGSWMTQGNLEKIVNNEEAGAYGSAKRKMAPKDISMREAEQEILSRLKFKVWQLKSIPYRDGFLVCGYTDVSSKAIAIWWCDGQEIFNVNGIARSNIKEFKFARNMINHISDAVKVCKEHRECDETVSLTSQDNGGLRISEDNYFGCIDRHEYEKLGKYAAHKDEKAFTKRLAANLRVGICTSFKKGETVYIVDTAFWSGLTKVRRRGEIKEYWTNSEALE